jgi:CubicO group peptidase (beta-lactamase class C family)
VRAHGIVASLVLGVCLAAQKPPAGTLVEKGLGAALDAAIRQAAKPFWGCAVVAADARLVLAKGYGAADYEKLPNGPRMLYDLGGLGALFTMAAALALAEDKKLGLEDPVAKRVAVWPEERGVRIRHLLEHTSGLPPDVPWQDGEAAALSTALQRFGAAVLVDEPGRAFHFSPLNANLLAAVVEQAAQMRFDEALRRLVLQPAGMSDTGPCQDRRLDDKRQTIRRSPGAKPGTGVLAFEMNWAHRGARGLVTTGLDLHAFFMALFAGKIFAPPEVERLLRPLPGPDGFAVRELRVAGEVFTELLGATAGYRTRVVVHTATRSWIVLLSNDLAELDPLEVGLAAILWRARLAAAAASAPGGSAGAPPGDAPARSDPAPAAGEPAPVTAAIAARFVGSYELRSGGALQIVHEGGALHLVGTGLQPAARICFARWTSDIERPLRRCEDRGLAALAAALQGDEPALRRCCRSDDAAAAVRVLLASLVQAHGPAAAPVHLGTMPKPNGNGAATGWFRVACGSTDCALELAFDAQAAIAGVVRAGAPPPFRIPLRVLRADLASARSLAGPAILVSIEGTGAARWLVYEDATPGAAGLLECPLAQ